ELSLQCGSLAPDEAKAMVALSALAPAANSNPSQRHGRYPMAGPPVQSVFTKHRPFALLTSLGFALLYAELGLFAQQAWRTRSDGEAALLIAAAFVLMLAAYIGSFWPARAYTVSGVERQGSLVLPTLLAQMGQGAGIILAAS